MTYTDKELTKAKEVLEACTFVSPSTKGCYSSRIALWLHFCNQCCNGDDRVTEERLAEYVEWMVSSGSAERIRQGSTHVQQVLRNQLQGVLCYWRIQNGNRSDLKDPRTGPIFMAKWQQIVMRHPRPRMSRRSEPIYGVQKLGPDGMDEYSSYNANGGMPAPAVNQTYTMTKPAAHPMGEPQPTPGIPMVHPRHRYPNTREEYMPRNQYPSYPGEHVGHDFQRPGESYPPHFMPPQQPQPISRMGVRESTPLGGDQGAPGSHYPARPGFPVVGQAAPSTQIPLHMSPPARATPSSVRDEPQAANKADDSASCQSAIDFLLDDTEYERPGSSNGSVPMDTDATAVPGTPEALVEESAALEGVVPEEIPQWTPSDDSEPEGNLLALHEAVALNVRQLEMGSDVQSQARAHLNLGMATWLASSTRCKLTLADVSMDEAAGTATSPVSAHQQTTPTTPKSGDKAASAKSMAIAIHSPSTDSSETSKARKSIAMRHLNPLLCPWNALAFELFRRWHVANEDIPDLATSEWQTLKLFPQISDDAESASTVDQLIHNAYSDISKDSVSGSKMMRDIGYFYADAFGLVRPTVDAVKGINCVDGIDTNVLLPEVLDSLTKVNAGHELKTQTSAESACPRFGVAPSQGLLKEVFPWIRPLLLKAYVENNNNKDVRSATRLLRLLRELRVVVLQDVALMMELPSLENALKSNELFSHSIFASDEFAKFREEMRKAVEESELKSMNEKISTYLQQTADYKAKYPDGNEKRTVPTAPRLDISKLQARRKKTESTVNLEESAQRHARLQQRERNPGAPASLDALSSPLAGPTTDVGHKRPLTPTQSSGESHDASREASIDIVGTGNKRQRRVYDAIVNAQPIAPHTEPVEVRTTPIQPRPIASNAIDELRVENEDLKKKLQRLEYTFGQHRVEMRSWMGKMEKIVHSIVSASSRPPTPPTEHGQPAFRQYAGQRQPMPAAMSGSGAVRGPRHPSQLPQANGSSYMVHQHRAYADPHYYHGATQAKQGPVQASGHQSPPLPASQDNLSDYDRMSLDNGVAPDGRPSMPQNRQRGYMPGMQPAMRANGIQQPPHPSEVNGNGSAMQSPRRMPNSQYMQAAEYGDYRRPRLQQTPSSQSQQMHPGYPHEQMYPGSHGPY